MSYIKARLGTLLILFAFAPAAPAAKIGDLLISELMANPAAVPDSRGEWFELYNPTGDTINLQGITLGDDGSDRHRIETDLLIMPNHFLVLARNGDAALNGGIEADYVYRDFILGNSADEIVLSDSSREWLRLAYDAGFTAPGRTNELSRLPMTPSAYSLTPASLVYGFGDIGTPGIAGSLAFPSAAVPLPGSVWLLAAGMLAVMGSARRKLAFHLPSSARKLESNAGPDHALALAT